jgi:hypothetical protein
MTSVFIGGSRDISRLNDEIKSRINNIIQQSYTVLIGDASGADKAAQKFLFESHYSQVIVFCAGRFCRNNIGKWPINNIDAPHKTNGFEFYALKDMEMAKIADFGFMLWDGKSAGTLNNIFALLRLHKKCLVFFSPGKAFFTISTLSELQNLLQKCNPEAVHKIDSKIHIEKLIENISAPEQISLSI